VAIAFAAVHRDWREYVELDPTLFRAAGIRSSDAFISFRDPAHAEAAKKRG
jgi:hypothetical protein